ncbi:cytochrome c oxidase subunit II [Hymenobacter latericus]|uniref:cytochrome c oxidase subunit II n=1 Tax=Hymenobacter sp. YIM 151858-1 TaxID=2987688 RepID=UPI0022275B6E|nr:cytochrome c oxidase subunit II [Hymenobacter sp. YIM 151858-1]UYZ59279.1 cytochrome c oxidase subunit II [Hymenobacter sp. YIM 151858-1]
MIALGILLALVLLLVVFGLLFRLQILTSIFSGSYNRPVGLSNRVNAILMLLFLIVGGAAFAYSFVDNFDKMNPPIASVHGMHTEKLFWTTMVVIGIVFVITQVALFVYSYRYQYREGRRAFFFSHNNKIEIIWTVIPAVVMSGLIFGGWKEWTSIMGPAPKDAIEVEVMGKQFNFLVRYPGRDQKLGNINYRLIDATNEFGFDLNDQRGMDDFTAGEVHVPKGHPVLMRIRSRDVLHAVYAPHFRVQMYAVPGMPTKFWFTPTKTTDEMRAQTGNPNFNYEIACNQICGRGHFAMKATIIVDEPEDYIAWYSQQKSFVEQNPDVLADFKQKKAASVEQAQAAVAVPSTVSAKAAL